LSNNSKLINGYLCRNKDKHRIYLSDQNLKCPYCVKPGAKKIYVNLWRFSCHLKTQHPNEEKITSIIQNLESLIREGILTGVRN